MNVSRKNWKKILIYRYKFLDFEDFELFTHSSIKVFYLDYGNTEFVHLNDIFEWNDICNSIQFQALLCKIANIRRLFEQMKPGTNYEEVAKNIRNFLTNKFVGTHCKATVR